MTNKLELKSSHEVIDTVDVADVESIFYCKPTDPDILTVLMKDRKRLYCDEICPLQEEPVSEGKDIFDNCLKSEEKFILPQKICGNINCENCPYSSACALGYIQACIIDKPVSEDLEEAANNHAAERYRTTRDMELAEKCKWSFKAGAEWQEEKDDEEKVLIYKHGFDDCEEYIKEHIKEVLLSEVLPCFMRGGEVYEVVDKLDEVLNQKK